MFESFTAFSIFYWSIATILLLMIIFEKKLLALEEKFDAWFIPKWRRFKRKSRKVFSVLKKDAKAFKKASKKAKHTFKQELMKSWN